MHGMYVVLMVVGVDASDVVTDEGPCISLTVYGWYRAHKVGNFLIEWFSLMIYWLPNDKN